MTIHAWYVEIDESEINAVSVMLFEGVRAADRLNDVGIPRHHSGQNAIVNDQNPISRPISN